MAANRESAVAASSSPASSASVPASAQVISSPSQQASVALSSTLGKNAVPIIWGGASTVIVVVLALSLRSTRRAERATSVIDAAEQILLKHAPLRQHVGPVLAGGSFQLATTAKSAAGWYNAGLSGKVQGRVHLEAHRPSRASGSPWEFSHLHVELDKQGLNRRAAERRAASVKAGYMQAEEADAAAAKDVDTTLGPAAGADLDDGETLYYAVIGKLDGQIEQAPQQQEAAKPEGEQSAATDAKGELR